MTQFYSNQSPHGYGNGYPSGSSIGSGYGPARQNIDLPWMGSQSIPMGPMPQGGMSFDKSVIVNLFYDGVSSDSGWDNTGYYDQPDYGYNNCLCPPDAYGGYSSPEWQQLQQVLPYYLQRFMDQSAGYGGGYGAPNPIGWDDVLPSKPEPAAPKSLEDQLAELLAYKKEHHIALTDEEKALVRQLAIKRGLIKEPTAPTPPASNPEADALFAQLLLFMNGKDSVSSTTAVPVTATSSLGIVQSALNSLQVGMPTAIYSEARTLLEGIRTTLVTGGTPEDLKSLLALAASQGSTDQPLTVARHVVTQGLGLTVDNEGKVTNDGFNNKAFKDLTMKDVKAIDSFKSYSVSELSAVYRSTYGQLPGYGGQGQVLPNLEAALADDNANPVTVYLLGQSAEALRQKQSIATFTDRYGQQLPTELRQHLWELTAQLELKGGQLYQLAIRS